MALTPEQLEEKLINEKNRRNSIEIKEVSKETKELIQKQIYQHMLLTDELIAELSNDFKKLEPLIDKSITSGEEFIFIPVPDVDLKKYKRILENYPISFEQMSYSPLEILGIQCSWFFQNFLKEKGFNVGEEKKIKGFHAEVLPILRFIQK